MSVANLLAKTGWAKNPLWGGVTTRLTETEIRSPTPPQARFAMVSVTSRGGPGASHVLPRSQLRADRNSNINELASNTNCYVPSINACKPNKLIAAQ